MEVASGAECTSSSGPVIVSVRHIATIMSAQSSLSAGFFSGDGGAGPLASRCGP